MLYGKNGCIIELDSSDKSSNYEKIEENLKTQFELEYDIEELYEEEDFLSLLNDLKKLVSNFYFHNFFYSHK